MNPLIVKILAVGLTISQLFKPGPEQFKPSFNEATDTAEVELLLNQGCDFMVKQFGLADLNAEFMLQTLVKNAERIKAKKAVALADPDPDAEPEDTSAPKTITAKLMDQLDMPTLLATYQQYCKGQKKADSPIKLGEVLAYYNTAMKDLPDVNKIVNMHLPEASTILDKNGDRFTEIYADNGRRHFVSLKDLPPYVKQAFVSAEDKRFFEHKGIDVAGVVRAFASSFTSKKRAEGASTITQQVAKNLLVGDDLTFERKMREMVIATRLERLLSKDQILELYVNYVFLGRASWGIEMASRSYFNKSAKRLTISEAAMLAGLTKGPNFYHPNRYPERVLERREYVLGRMKEDGYIKPEEQQQASATPMLVDGKVVSVVDGKVYSLVDGKVFTLTDGKSVPAEGKTAKDIPAVGEQKLALVPFVSPVTRASYYYLDEIQRDARRKAGLKSLTGGSYVVKSTLHPELQMAAEEALEDGLAKYEMDAKRALWTGPVGSISEDLVKYKSTWQDILPRRHSKYYDIQWPLAVVTSTGGQQKVRAKNGNLVTVSTGFKVGLKDGREMALSGSGNVLATLKVNDLIHVRLDETKKLATLLIPPRVQGGVVVLEAKTGRVLAMAGGFSYSQSQLNRVTQSARQPGSTLKPFVHLTALQKGLQPDTLIPDVPLSLPPLGNGGHWWTPHNFDRGSGGLVSMRQTVEQSLNIATERVMASMSATPQEGLDAVREVTQDLGIYDHPIRDYPFVLGAQPARLLDLAVAYATIANIANTPNSVCPNCMKPIPRFIDTIDQDGTNIYPQPRFDLQPVNKLDRVSLFQMRRIMEGTVARGTAVSIKDLAGSVAAKTGTSNNENDAWFICMTNDLVIATWVGYDSRKVMPNLGAGNTGAHVALPIGERILRRSFEVYRPQEPLSPIPVDLQDQIVEYPIPGYGFEAYRVIDGQVLNTRSSILRGNEVGMALTDGAGEELSPGEARPLADDDQGEYEQHAAADPENPGVAVGAEDDLDLWRQRNRKVDPSFLEPPFFMKNQEN